MKAQLFIFLFVSICCPVFGDEIYCSIEVKTPSVNFQKRLEKKLHDEMKKNELFNFSKEALLVNSKNQYKISIRYPVYPFPNKASIYVVIKFKNDLTRYLTISHHAISKANLTIEKQEVLIDKATSILLNQLSIESGFKSGPGLKPGYYTNHQAIPLSQTLDIKLMEIQDTKPTELQGFSQRKKLYKEKTTMLQEKKNETVTKYSPLNSREKYEKTQYELELEYNSKKRAKLYLDLSKLYEINNNKTKALKFAEKSLYDYHSYQSLDKVRSLKGDSANWINRFRLMNKKRQIKIRTDFNFEYDNNVIQEAVDAFTHTNTEDTSFQGTLNIDKTWGLKLGSLENTSSYSFKNTNYGSHKNLDLTQHRIGHQLSTNWLNGKGFSMISMGMGYIYFTRHTLSLLSGHDASIGFAHYMKPQKLLLSSNFSFLNTKFTENFFNAQEMSGKTIVFSSTAQKTLGKKLKHQASLTARYREERPGKTYLGNDSYHLISEWKYKPNFFFDSISYFYLFEHQRYKDIDEQGDLRIDDKISTGMEFSKSHRDNLFFKANYTFTDNQSNLRVKRYIRQQVTLHFGILF